MCLTWLNISLEADRRVNQERRGYGLSAYKSLEDVVTVEGKGSFHRAPGAKNEIKTLKAKINFQLLRNVF